jgi:hypothetical protein
MAAISTQTGLSKSQESGHHSWVSVMPTLLGKTKIAD